MSISYILKALYWRRQWQPTPVLLPGKSHGLRSLLGYSPWGRKEPDMTEQLHGGSWTIVPPVRQYTHRNKIGNFFSLYPVWIQEYYE